MRFDSVISNYLPHPLNPPLLKRRGGDRGLEGLRPSYFPFSFPFLSFGFLGFFTFFLPLVPILFSYFLTIRYTTCKPRATASPIITQAKSLLPSHVSSLITTTMTIIREIHKRYLIIILLCFFSQSHLSSCPCFVSFIKQCCVNV